MLEQIELVHYYLPWFFPTVIFIFGAIVGSFLNVCIYRIPAKKSVVSPGSHCYACGKPIAFYDNIPILSWIILRGKARCCDAPFSVRYAIIEFLTGLLFLACFFLRGPEVIVPGMVFIAILVCATATDLDGFIIPEVFTVGGFIAGVLLAIFFPALHGFESTDLAWIGSMRSGIMATIGGIVGSGIILWLAMLAEAALRKQAMGFGDVVFLGMIGTFCGWQGAIFSLFGGAIIGVFIGIPLMMLGVLKSSTVEELMDEEEPGEASETKNEAKEPEIEAKEPTTEEPATGEPPSDSDEKQGIRGLAIPFGPMLAAGGLIYFLWAHQFVEPYINEFAMLVFSDGPF